MSLQRKNVIRCTALLALGCVSFQIHAQAEMAQIPALVSAASAAAISQSANGAMLATLESSNSVLDTGAPVAGAGLFGLLLVTVARRKRRRPH
ncbi:hypothetical protein [Hydrocarboniphaga sp.]|uniref:hypothetical protein n=1 Tax=Hydrocarboniphaga sp. TaxID=2033016 RepID=UPI003D128FE7